MSKGEFDREAVRRVRLVMTISLETYRDEGMMFVTAGQKSETASEDLSRLMTVISVRRDLPRRPQRSSKRPHTREAEYDSGHHLLALLGAAGRISFQIPLED